MTGAPPAESPGWPAADQQRYRAAGYWAGATFGELLRGWAQRYGNKTALVDGAESAEDARRWTYAELDRQADRLCAGLRRLGLRRGDRVIVHLPNCAEFVLLWFALQRLGAVPVHAVPGHRRAEIGHLAAQSGAVAYVVSGRDDGFDYLALAGEVRTDALRHIIVVGAAGPDHVPYADLVRTEPDREPPPGPSPADLALLLLSGGSTGMPKLIPRTHDDYAYNGRAYAEVCEMDAGSVYLAVLPVAFNYTFACPGVLGALTVGGTAVIAPDPSPDTAFWLIERERVTITAINPPLVPLWLGAYQAGRPDLSSLRVLQVGSARLADDLARRIEPTLGVRLQQGYGMAEGLLNCTRLDDPDELVYTTQGRPISPGDELRVVDPDTGDPLPDGGTGELLTRGPYTIRGYYRGGAANTTSFTADGFYRTGDLVRRLGSGHLIVVGRLKDQINRGGEKIAASEVEGHLVAHPAIRAAAVVAARDPLWGETPVAFLVCDAPPPSVGDLATFLAGRGLAAYKAPARVEVVDNLPLTPVGKIDKAALRATLTANQVRSPAS
jgi:2,3-dihydroxybenzoate-AMP ligase